MSIPASQVWNICALPGARSGLENNSERSNNNNKEIARDHLFGSSRGELAVTVPEPERVARARPGQPRADTFGRRLQGRRGTSLAFALVTASPRVAPEAFAAPVFVEIHLTHASTSKLARHLANTTGPSYIMDFEPLPVRRWVSARVVHAGGLEAEGPQLSASHGASRCNDCTRLRKQFL